ncbi:hypothetical protein PLICRDRAFT_90491 [Plicaturopsis crispa FD-325 SS-3]|nr:hypothetical protein PLICRDRAFT_90491 [Plicaturopsis crispa FD-325 SS-3]
MSSEILQSSKGVALVTGSARGIGRAIALRLADDGFDVAVNDVLASRDDLEALRTEILEKGRKSHVVPADVSVEEEVKEMVSITVAELGGLDVMVANAGVLMWAPFFDTTVEQWDRLFSINVRGVMLCYKYAGQQMVAQGRGGRLIAASSFAGQQGLELGSAYCASKFAVRGLTQSVAAALGKHNITVNSYAPGLVDTPLFRVLVDKTTDLLAVTPELVLKQLADKAALGHIGTVADIANLVSFIASKESQFITGQNFSSDGGLGLA